MFRVYSIPSYKTRGLAVGALLPSTSSDYPRSQVTRKHGGVAAAEEPPLRDTWADWLLKLYKLIWSRVSGPLFDSTKSPQIAENAPPPPITKDVDQSKLKPVAYELFTALFDWSVCRGVDEFSIERSE